MEKIEILKGKITKNQTLEICYLRHNEDESTTVVDEKDCENLVHPDLVNAFQKLAPHMALLCDLRESDIIGKGKGKKAIDAIEPEHFSKFEIKSFSIGGDGEGVTISGNKKLNSAQIFNINTPFQKYEDELSDYQWGSELAEAMERCKYEVQEYLNGKCAAKQTELQFVGTDGGEEVHA